MRWLEEGQHYPHEERPGKSSREVNKSGSGPTRNRQTPPAAPPRQTKQASAQPTQRHRKSEIHSEIRQNPQRPQTHIPVPHFFFTLCFSRTSEPPDFSGIQLQAASWVLSLLLLCFWHSQLNVLYVECQSCLPFVEDLTENTVYIWGKNKSPAWRNRVVPATTVRKLVRLFDVLFWAGTLQK